MKRNWKRFLAGFMAVIMTVMLLPTAVWAGLVDNDPAYNREILSQLEALCGSESEAEGYYALLQNYGLLDEDGNLVEEWSVTLDDREVTLEELRTILAGDYDPAQLVMVDGTPVTLKDLDTIIAIEDYIAYLRETYFDPDTQQWTAESVSNYLDLKQQLQTEGIELLAGERAASPSINHNARVTASFSLSGNTLTVTCNLTDAAEGQAVSFDWMALSGSRGVSGGKQEGTVSFVGDETKQFTVTLDGLRSPDGADGLRTMKSLYVVNFYNIENALFQAAYGTVVNGHGDAMYWVGDGGKTISGIPNVNGFTESVSKTLPFTDDSQLNEERDVVPVNQSVGFTGDKLNFLRWGMASHMQVSIKTASGGLLYSDGENYKNYQAYIRDGTAPDGSPMGFDIAKYAHGTVTVGGSKAGIWHGHDYTLTNTGYPDNFIQGTKGPGNTPTKAALGNMSGVSGADFSFEIGHYMATIDGTYRPGSNLWKCETALNGVSEYKLEAKFTDERAPGVEKVTVPAGTYYPGMVVPITVRFNELVSMGGGRYCTATINGRDVTGLGSGEAHGNEQVFLYVVPETGSKNITSISIKSAWDFADHEMKNVNILSKADFSSVKYGTIKAHVVENVTAAAGGTTGEPVLNVGVKITGDTVTNSWMGSGVFIVDPDDASKFITQTAAPAGQTSMYVSIDGGTTKYPLTAGLDGNNLPAFSGQTLTAAIPLDISPDAVPRTVELWIDDQVVVGKLDTAEQPAAVFVESGDLQGTLSVKASDGTTDYPYDNIDNKVIYPQDAPKITASFTLSDKEFSFGDTTRTGVGVYDPETNVVTPAEGSDGAHFLWSVVSNTENPVANIDANGTVTPTGSSGEATVYLTAWNGGVVVNGQSAVTTVEVGTLNFGAGLSPFLTIPNDQIASVSGKDVAVFWSSNLCDKNGETPTEFTVTVTKDGEIVPVPEGVDFENPKTVTGTASNPAASVTIPGKLLQYEYGEEASNTYTVMVTCVYEGTTHFDDAEISLESRPAVVKLDKLPTYYITDTQGPVSIGWQIDNFDRFSSGDGGQLFQFQIKKNGNLVYTSSDPGTGNASSGVYDHVYSLADIDVTADKNSPTGYRDVYTVSIKAKNGTDSTWSYDSFLLYVYDEDALKIWVDGDTVEGDGLTMSNIPAISEMDPADILALKRDIYLKNIVSVNYGEYAWGEIADQIGWESTNDETATLNYQEGTLYDNIENFSYVSYRPTVEFGLSGLKDGSTTIQATHKLTNVLKELNVTVETLKDHLYLFQCYPSGVTTLTFAVYTDAARTATRTETISTDGTGAAAYYAEFGIAGDVYCKAWENNDVLYLGTIRKDDLKSGEGDWTKLERYPVNTVELRRAAYAYLYLKNPDGTPYYGYPITFRGGVYVNGVYKEKAQFLLNNKSMSSLGSEGQTAYPNRDGKLTVVMDQSQWDLPENTVQAGDQVEYVFQIEGEGGAQIYPMLVSVDASASQDAFVNSGSAVAAFRPSRLLQNEKRDFVAMQTVSYSDYDVPHDLLNYTGKVGPNDSYPEAELTTVVMWWGQGGKDPAKRALRFQSANGKAIADGAGETTTVNDRYPFSQYDITTYTVKLTNETIGDVVDSGRSTGLMLDYYPNGTSQAASRQEPMRFGLANLCGLGKVEDQVALQKFMEQMGDFMEGATFDPNDEDYKQVANTLGQDQYLKKIVDSLKGFDYVQNKGQLFQLKVVPTRDPAKFLGFVEVNVGDGKEDAVVSKANKSTEKPFYSRALKDMMTLAQRGDDPEDVEYRMGHEKVLDRKAFTLGGYMEVVIYYNEDNGLWEMQPLSGGFHAGGGINQSYGFTTWLGPIPATYKATVNGTGEVRLDALASAYYDADKDTNALGTDFLTELRFDLYVKFFAGVGIDYSVVAAKIGGFGQIGLTARSRWLNRPYIEEGDKEFSVPEEYAARFGSNKTVDGYYWTFPGQIGIEIYLRLLFVRYEKILYSKPFELPAIKVGWDAIEKTWANTQKAKDDAIKDLTRQGLATTYNVGSEQMVALNLAPTLESRDYLNEGGRQWGPGFSFFALDGESALKNLESNTYPYANPVVSDDGQIVGYLSDQNSTDVERTHAAFAIKNGDSYNRGTIIPDGGVDVGYGDSQLSLSGTENFAVAAWVRQNVSVDKDAANPETGEVILTDEDQMMMLNGTDVCVSIYDGSAWTTERLTDNSSPDLAPVVATNGDRAIVAWRAVSASGDPVTGEGGEDYMGMTNFDQKDTILYRVYNGTDWTETQTLYNGTSGAVKGIVAEMLSDGTAAVAYTLDSDRSDSTPADREVVYAVVGKETDDSGAYPVTANVRATNDAYLDENPQLASVTFPNQDGTDGEERFVLGWFTEQGVATDGAETLNGGTEATNGSTVSDIRLLDFDASGAPGQLLPDSINQASDAYDVDVTSNFRFTKNAETINDLSILWVERADTTGDLFEGAGTEEDKTDDIMKADHDLLKGVKFYTYGEKNDLIGFTGAVDVADMNDAKAGTLIDHFDAYVSKPEDNEIKAVILGTTYGELGTKTETVTLADGETQAVVTVPTQSSAMYTATETYADKIEVTSVLADYDTVRKGATTQISFTIKNRGIHAIEQLDFLVGSRQTVYGDLNLLPGQSIRLYADYDVPDKITDPGYTVKANFKDGGDSGATGAARTIQPGTGFFADEQDLTEASGTVYLNLPDVAVTEATITREESGERDILIKLNNRSDADLYSNGGREVKVSFYTDATCENAIPAGFGLDPIIISDDADLTMIDEGGYSKLVTFNVGEYVKDGGIDAKEIPESGVRVYVKAEVMVPRADKSVVQGEPYPSDNYASVTCDNLKVRTGEDVTIDTDFTADENGTTVSVTLQNTRLTKTTTGNVIVTLLDENGNVLEQKQSFTGSESGDNGLIELEGEAKKSLDPFTFTQKGASVQVTYSDLILNADNANLASLTFTNISDVSLESFTDPDGDGTYTAVVSTDDLTSTLVVAVTETALATAALKDSSRPGGNAVSENVALVPGESKDIVITVESRDGTQKKTYVLTVQNNGEPVITPPTGTGQTGEYSASVFYAADGAEVTINASASGSYALDYQWYSCDLSGNNRVLLTDETASTLHVANDVPAGVHYYICEVTRHLLNGGTVKYDSSVASVQIKKATDNSVTLVGTTVDFDNKPHGLTSAVAEKESSTLCYSTDKGESWTEEAPAFTSVGAHTVWVKATNPNYEDTAVYTADVVIQEVESTEYRLETSAVEESFSAYPAEIREKYGSVEELETALKAEVTKLGAPAENTAVYEVKLLFSVDRGATWQEATAENFPGSVTVKLPYPDKTGRYSHNFYLKHLITDPLNTGKQVGEIEDMDITLDEDGIRFTADCLSPFVLGWSVRPTDTSSPAAAVTVEQPQHGTVSVSPVRASQGQTVTITAKPEEGYEVDTVTVTNSGGKKLTVKDQGSGVYTFVMPYGPVTVQVTYKPASAAWNNPFTDVSEGAWYYDAVRFAYERGLMAGTSKTTFGPNVTTSRAMIAAILHRLEGSPSVDYAMDYSDVVSGSWYEEAVRWATAQGVVAGYDDGQFRPDAPITREQLAAMLWRYAGSPMLMDYEGLSQFRDIGDLSSWAQQAMAWVHAEGIVSGKGDKLLDPKGQATRAEAASMLQRFVEKQER